MCIHHSNINLKQSTSRRWLTFDRKRASYRKRYRKPIRKELEESITPLLNQIEITTNFENLVNNIGSFVDNTGFTKIYAQMYNHTFNDFSKYDFDNVKKSTGFSFQKKNEEDIVNDIIQQEINNYILSGEIGAKIVMIGDTSQKHLKNILDKLIPEVLEQGLSFSEAQTMLRDRVKSEWHRAARYRTERIVRTEISAASNSGSFFGVGITGMARSKTWIPAFDERTRRPPKSDFNHVHTQVVNFNEGFTRTGEPLQYPSDWANGTAGNIINCRCTLSYSTKPAEQVRRF